MAYGKRTRKRPVEAFGKALAAALLADMSSEPEPQMLEVLESALARFRAGGAA